MDAWIKNCSQKEETIFAQQGQEFMCSATGATQVLAPEFLLRQGFCAVKGCKQPHNGSGIGRCQIHETSHVIKTFEQKGTGGDTAIICSVNIAMWMKELKDRGRLNNIEAGPIKYTPLAKGKRKEQLPREKSERPQYEILGGGYHGQYPSGAVSRSNAPIPRPSSNPQIVVTEIPAKQHRSHRPLTLEENRYLMPEETASMPSTSAELNIYSILELPDFDVTGVPNREFMSGILDKIERMYR